MKKLVILFVAYILTSSAICAQDEQTETELAKEARNPVADIISIPFQKNITYRIGEDQN
jgi:hypothetical protein